MGGNGVHGHDPLHATRASDARGSARLEAATAGDPPLAEVLGAILDATDEAVLSTGLDGTVLTWNRACERLYGYPSGEAIGAHVGFIVPEERRGELELIYVRVARGEQVGELETERLDRDGRLVPVSLKVSPLHDAAGRLVGASTVAADLTARRHTDRAVAQLAAVIESSSDAIISFLLDGRISSWNPGAERLYGLAAEEVLGRPASRVIPDGPTGGISSRLAALAMGESVGELETAFTRKDGTAIDIAARLSPMIDHLGRVVGASAIVRDITERLAGERALRASEALLERAQSIAHVGGWVASLTDSSLTWTRETYRIFGLEPGTPLTVEDFLGRVHPEDLDAIAQARANALTDADGLYEVEHRIVRPDGTVRWVLEVADVSWASDGTPLNLTGVVQDVTARREAERAIRESERRFRLLAENARDLIFLYRLEPEPGFEFVSPAAAAVTGYAAADFLANPHLLEVIVGPAQYAQLSTRVVAAGFEGAWDVEITRGDGEVAWVNLRLTPIAESDGHLVAIEGIARDITEQRLSEIHRRNLARRLLRVQEEERAAIANDVHDEPLQTITAVSIQLQVLASRLSDPDLAPLVSTIQSSLATSIEQLRGLLFELHPPALDLGGLVESLREFLRRYEGIGGPTVEITDLLGSRLNADEAVALFRIAREALANAYRHACAQQVRVELAEIDEGLVLVVEDDGVGFSTEREQMAGHLGLASIRERAERVGGQVTIRSVEGAGTTLTVSIPRLPT